MQLTVQCRRGGAAGSVAAAAAAQGARRSQMVTQAHRDTPSIGAAAGAQSLRAADFVRPHLKTMAPYTPIEPFDVLSQRLGRDPKDIVKLDANENPYGPPPGVPMLKAKINLNVSVLGYCFIVTLY